MTKLFKHNNVIAQWLSVLHMQHARMHGASEPQVEHDLVIYPLFDADHMIVLNIFDSSIMLINTGRNTEVFGCEFMNIAQMEHIKQEVIQFCEQARKEDYFQLLRIKVPFDAKTTNLIFNSDDRSTISATTR